MNTQVTQVNVNPNVNSKLSQPHNSHNSAFIGLSEDDARKALAIARVIRVVGPYEDREFAALPHATRREIVELWSEVAGLFDAAEMERHMVRHGKVDISGYRAASVLRQAAPNL